MLTKQEAKNIDIAATRVDNLLKALAEKRILSLIVEPTSECNLSCTFCDMHSGRYDTDHRKGMMSDAVFDKLLTDLQALPYKMAMIQFHGYGEPLLNKKIAAMLAACKSRGLAGKLRIITNGTVLKPEILEELLNSGVDEIHISLDAFSREEYQTIKGKDFFDKLMRNIYAAAEAVEQRQTVQLYIKLASSDAELYGITDSLFQRGWDGLKTLCEHSQVVHLKDMPVFHTHDGQKIGFAGSNAPCEMPFYMAYVKFDGKISACCADIFGELAIGDLSQQSLREILEGRALNDIRKTMLGGDLKHQKPICYYCGAKTVVDLSAHAEQIRTLLDD
ncbi:radical SAM/SPASM domain-containing protein [Methylomonas sp. MED-D]|uniref:radical SAM/SPASM domain-containing protein n=1 Tax=unclassified Methylomonas TaxID=2608980 RepID=UPI0028A4B966|nr:radical SAM protein [Methylomonas sp. MV1]MDT4329978.1 radical SAM protein [Methylomonas sp. MV1]